MVPDPAGGAHARAGHNHAGLLDLVDSLRFLGRAGHRQARKAQWRLVGVDHLPHRFIGVFVEAVIDIGHIDGGHFDTGTDVHHGEVAHGHSSTRLFSLISFRTIVAALTFFGLSGYAAIQGGQTRATALILAFACGVAQDAAPEHDGRVIRVDRGVATDSVHDQHGFDEVDRKLLRTIIDKFGGGPVGINSIAAAISEEKDAIEDIYEPFLIQIGFLDRTPRGRVATALAYNYFGLTAPGRGLW
jgi:hypothetical protein